MQSPRLLIQASTHVEELKTKNNNKNCRFSSVSCRSKYHSFLHPFSSSPDFFFFFPHWMLVCSQRSLSLFSYARDSEVPRFRVMDKEQSATILQCASFCCFSTAGQASQANDEDHLFLESGFGMCFLFLLLYELLFFCFILLLSTIPE